MDITTFRMILKLNGNYLPGDIVRYICSSEEEDGKITVRYSYNKLLFDYGFGDKKYIGWKGLIVFDDGNLNLDIVTYGTEDCWEKC